MSAKFYTVKEAAEQLTVSPNKIRTMIKNGVLRAVDLRDKKTARACIRVRREDVDKYLQPVIVREEIPIKAFKAGSFMERWHNTKTK